MPPRSGVAAKAGRRSRLLHSQRLERIDARRPPRGNPAREQSHTDHEYRHER